MKNCVRFLSHSYLFWALCSLQNFAVFGTWLVPFVLPVALYQVLATFPFLIGPLVLALGSSLLVLLILAIVARMWCRHTVVPMLLAYVFNASFLAVFLNAAEKEKNIAIAKELRQVKPECVHVQSLLTSIRNTGEKFHFEEHALYKAGGKTYYWSYATMRFFEGNDRLDPNFPCR